MSDPLCVCVCMHVWLWLWLCVYLCLRLCPCTCINCGPCACVCVCYVVCMRNDLPFAGAMTDFNARVVYAGTRRNISTGQPESFQVPNAANHSMPKCNQEQHAPPKSFSLPRNTRTRTHTRTHAHARTRTHTRTHTHASTHARTHAHTHTRIPPPPPSRPLSLPRPFCLCLRLGCHHIILAVQRSSHCTTTRPFASTRCHAAIGGTQAMASSSPTHLGMKGRQENPMLSKRTRACTRTRMHAHTEGRVKQSKQTPRVHRLVCFTAHSLRIACDLRPWSVQAASSWQLDGTTLVQVLF